jgi:hypothetical protein
MPDWRLPRVRLKKLLQVRLKLISGNRWLELGFGCCHFSFYNPNITGHNCHHFL